MSEAVSEAAAPPAKKRRWRKPSSQVTDSVNNEENCNKIIQSNNLMHPEMLSEVDLVSRLNEYHVPMENNCSRDELVELFSKHVMPKPQRKRNRGEQLQVNKSLRVTITEHSLATAPHDNVPMATCNSSDDRAVVGRANKDRAVIGGANKDQAIVRGANTEGANKVVTKRKQSNDPSPPHRKKAFIRNDITWP